MTFKTVQTYQNTNTNEYTPPYGQVVFSFARLDTKDGSLIEQHAASPCLEFLYNFANTLWHTKIDANDRHMNWWNPKDTGLADPDPDKFRIFARYKHCNDAPIETFIRNIVTILNPIEHTLGIEPTTADELDVPKQRIVLLTADHRLHNTCLSFSLWMNLVRGLMYHIDGNWLDKLNSNSLFTYLETLLPPAHPQRGRLLLAWIDLWPKLIQFKPKPWTGLPASESCPGSCGVGTFGNFVYLHARNEWAKSDLGKFVKKELFFP